MLCGKKGTLVFSTYFGGSGTDYCGALAWGPGGSIYFGGSTFSTDLPLKNPIQTTVTTRNGSNTAFVARLSADGSMLEYATCRRARTVVLSVGGQPSQAGVTLAVQGN